MRNTLSLILIQGHPCTGKTHLARVLSKEFGFTLLSRDEFKELLFDELGVKDREWSIKLGGVSYELLFRFMEKILITQSTLIVESNFDLKKHKPQIEHLALKYNYQVIEILLQANHLSILERFRKRWISGERHLGHVDHERFKDLEERVGNIPVTLGLGSKVIRFDTTNFPPNNWAEILDQIRIMLQGTSLQT